jgi:hypothetical protein
MRRGLCAIDTNSLPSFSASRRRLVLLRRSMGRSIADHYWERMLYSKPHPNDVQEGEQ